jgi:DNA-binding NarL/FixJ family response regulator
MKKVINRSDVFLSQAPPTVVEAAKPDPIKLMIIDDRRFFLEVLHLFSQRETKIQIVGQAQTAQQALFLMTSIKPEVAMLSFSVPGVGDEFIATMRKLSPTTKILVLNIPDDGSQICQVIRAGARGCISNDATLADISSAIEAVHQGEFWLEKKHVTQFIEEQTPSASVEKARNQTSPEELTSREKDVLKCLTTGCTNKEIALKLLISEKTVKIHLSSIFRKLKVTKRLQAIVLAINRGLA